MLFGDKYFRGKDQEAIKKRQAIEYASQICIDQFGKSHSSMLVLLQERVPRLKSVTLESINLDASALNHRQHTHLGWDYPYTNNALNDHWSDTMWPARKEVMLATMEHVFNFNGIPSVFDPIVDYNDQCKAFCSLIYYVHLLGDHLEFTLSSYHRSSNGVLGKDQVIPLGSSRGDSLISELIKCLPVLFPNQDYSELERKLSEANSQICSLHNKSDYLQTETGFLEYHQQAENVLEILHDHLPGLLKQEDYFKKAFY